MRKSPGKRKQPCRARGGGEKKEKDLLGRAFLARKGKEGTEGGAADVKGPKEKDRWSKGAVGEEKKGSTEVPRRVEKKEVERENRSRAGRATRNEKKKIAARAARFPEKGKKKTGGARSLVVGPKNIPWGWGDECLSGGKPPLALKGDSLRKNVLVWGGTSRGRLTLERELNSLWKNKVERGEKCPDPN